MSDDGDTLSVADLVAYCETQARLLAGRAATIGEETDELLSEIDEDIAEIRTRLAARSSGPESPDAGPAPGGDADEVAQLEELERDLEEKQAVAEAEQARMQAFQDLSTAYADLAAELDESVDDGSAALTRVVEFEQERDAPAYFDDKLTVLEAAADSNE
jgi:hypothetical protein